MKTLLEYLNEEVFDINQQIPISKGDEIFINCKVIDIQNKKIFVDVINKSDRIYITESHESIFQYLSKMKYALYIRASIELSINKGINLYEVPIRLGETTSKHQGNFIIECASKNSVIAGLNLKDYSSRLKGCIWLDQPITFKNSNIDVTEFIYSKIGHVTEEVKQKLPTLINSTFKAFRGPVVYPDIDEDVMEDKEHHKEEIRQALINWGYTDDWNLENVGLSSGSIGSRISVEDYW